MISQNISVICSIVAFVLSVYALVSVSKIKNNIEMDLATNGVFKPIKNIPDVEIVKPDGTVQSINAFESKDKLSKFLEEKTGDKSEGKRDANNIKHEDKAVKDVKQDNASGKKASNATTDSKTQSAGNIQKQVDRQNSAIPVARDGKEGKKTQDKQVANSVKSVNNVSTSIDGQKVVKNKISGEFVVQIGALKDRVLAEKQCKKVADKIGNKKCGVATTNNQFFRVIIYPFATNNEATSFVNRLAKERISGFVKRNA